MNNINWSCTSNDHESWAIILFASLDLVIINWVIDYSNFEVNKIVEGKCFPNDARSINNLTLAEAWKIWH